jgi:dTDP-4-dehydrorhamnose reductase
VDYEKKKILIIGGSGYIGRSLSTIIDGTYNVFSTYFAHRNKIALGKAIHLDVRNRASIKNILKNVRPDVVFLLAYALSDLERTIIHGASHVVNSAECLGARVIFLSSDVVFSGMKHRYFEHDITDAVNDYGRAKSKAEESVLGKGGHVIRTSLVYGFDPMDHRTYRLINDLRTGETGTAYFYDEYRCPIFVFDLCNMLADCIKSAMPPILHMAGPECMSRLDFAQRLAVAHGFDKHRIRSASLKISGLERPGFLCIDSSLAQKVLNCRIRPLEEILSDGSFTTQEKPRRQI